LMSLILMYEPGGIVSIIEKIQDRYLKPKKVRRKEST